MSECRTTCAYCGVGCGVQITTDDSGNGQMRLTGDLAHTANRGELCAKGLSLLEGINLPNKLLYPRVRSSDPEAYNRVSWPAAIEEISKKIAEVIEKYGPDSVAFYLSGQLLTEDYYIANKLAKGFIGTANIDTNSRLCMSSAVSAHIRAFGEDVVPGCYQDFELADVVVLVGANTAWTHPVLFKRILAAQKLNGTKLVVVDPRQTATASYADLHLQLKPGSDLALFNGLFCYLADSCRAEQAFIAEHTQGFETTLSQISGDASLAKTVEKTGLKESQLIEFYSFYHNSKPDSLQPNADVNSTKSAKPKVVTASGQGVNQSIIGTDTSNAIINCHLAIGDIGKPGCGPFSLTGQPNAMGGREVGGMATQLAAHMGFSTAEKQLLQTFWQAPTMAQRKGHTATELFAKIAQGEIRAVWILGTNPLVSLPNSTEVKKALKSCDVVVVSDVTADTDTAQCADILLPAQGWSEKSGTVTNSERTISRQRGFIKPQGDAMPDWWALCEVAKALGFNQGFNFEGSEQIFIEFAKLTAQVSAGFKGKKFDLAGLQQLTKSEYDNLKPTQWPLISPSQIGQKNQRLYADGVFSTADGKANFVPPHLTAPRSSEQQTTSGIWLNSGRHRDQWHSMTRTGHIASLTASHYQPELFLNQLTIDKYQLTEGGFAKLSSLMTVETMLARVVVDESMQDESGFISMHWSRQYNRCGGVNHLLQSVCDPHSLQPGFKHQKVQVAPFRVALNGIEWGQSCINPNTLCWQVTQTLVDGKCNHFAAELPWLEVIGSAKHKEPVVNNLPQSSKTQPSKSLSWLFMSHQIHCTIAEDKLVGLCITYDDEVQIDVNAAQHLLGDVFEQNGINSLHQLLINGSSPVVCACTGVTQKSISDTMQRYIEQSDDIDPSTAHQQKPLNQHYQQALVADVQSRLKCSSVCGSCLNQVNDIACRVLSENSVLATQSDFETQMAVDPQIKKKRWCNAEKTACL
ncbi:MULTISPECIES: molybdopterin-dependent oxidoreductase [unclassified Shewanella]|uniref:molybdopterin-dependent oxidoreductase n=1 Tax=unclassified Shewanella TaxID=196818 RepID=UPI001BBD0A1F|nr:MULTISPECIES: molybdopterin-dependent oxidoreductase [unclassified Shewanella]GIU07904.1 nitrate reductase [Shewanella sp. MBTL60-112-B1]GIU30573.1 nitrate reductase [Shewanella sp. MBTL60-112-B2]